MSKFRRFNPKMVNEWWRVHTGTAVQIHLAYSPDRGVENMLLWCEENCRGRWTYGDNSNVHWNKLKSVVKGNYELLRSFYFKHRIDAIRFKLIFAPNGSV